MFLSSIFNYDIEFLYESKAHENEATGAFAPKAEYVNSFFKGKKGEITILKTEGRWILIPASLLMAEIQSLWNQQGAKSSRLDTSGKSEDSGNWWEEQLRVVRRNGGIRSNRGRQDVGFLWEEVETGSEDLAGKGTKIRSPQWSVLRKGVSGSCSMQRHCWISSTSGAWNIDSRGGPAPTSHPAHSLRFTLWLTLSVTHINNQHSNSDSSQSKSPNATFTLTSMPFRNGFFSPPPPSQKRWRFVSAPASAPFTF